jgi:hypothetical protein
MHDVPFRSPAPCLLCTVAIQNRKEYIRRTKRPWSCHYKRGYRAKQLNEKLRKIAYVCGYDSGDVAGEMAGDSLWSLVATIVKGARLPVLVLMLPGAAGCDALPLAGAALLDPGGVVDSSSSGMGGQYVLRTCLSAGRRMGLERKKSIPESIHSCKYDQCLYDSVNGGDAYLYVALLGISCQSDNWRGETGLSNESR